MNESKVSLKRKTTNSVSRKIGSVFFLNNTDNEHFSKKTKDSKKSKRMSEKLNGIVFPTLSPESIPLASLQFSHLPEKTIYLIPGLSAFNQPRPTHQDKVYSLFQSGFLKSILSSLILKYSFIYFRTSLFVDNEEVQILKRNSSHVNGYSCFISVKSFNIEILMQKRQNELESNFYIKNIGNSPATVLTEVIFGDDHGVMKSIFFFEFGWSESLQDVPFNFLTGKKDILNNRDHLYHSIISYIRKAASDEITDEVPMNRLRDVFIDFPLKHSLSLVLDFPEEHLLNIKDGKSLLWLSKTILRLKSNELNTGFRTNTASHCSSQLTFKNLLSQLLPYKSFNEQNKTIIEKEAHYFDYNDCHSSSSHVIDKKQTEDLNSKTAVFDKDILI